MISCRRGDQGVLIVELAIAISVTVIALILLMSSIVFATDLNRMNEETAAASAAANDVIETLRGLELVDVYALYNSDPDDDPGPGAPGPSFAVAGLEPLEGAETVGRIEFPESEPGILAEDVDDEKLGMPRDLNGDGTIDGVPRNGDYLLLPVRVVVEWMSFRGPRSIEISALMAGASG